MVRSALVAASMVVVMSTGAAGATSPAAVGDSTSLRSPRPVTHRPAPRPAPAIGARGIEMKALNAVVQRYCQGCHNARSMRGNLNLDGFSVDSAFANPDVAEKSIRKLRTEMMPPPTSRKPAGDTLLARIVTPVMYQLMASKWRSVVTVLGVTGRSGRTMSSVSCNRSP